ncbi:MAG: hypothetical protein PHC70_05325 [Patescibacteria group bacterium]|nr:hypothetical protein [Patescibacteria group bacterium]
MLIQSRITLFPHGPSATEYRDTLRKQLIYCGADEGQIHETCCNGDLERYIAFIKRFNDVAQETKTPPIVVMTKTTLLARNVIAIRSTLTDECPALERALWIIFSPKDPFFQKNAMDMGRFITSHGLAPIWCHENQRPDGGKTMRHYLVLAPRMSVETAQAGAIHYNKLISAPVRRASSTFKIKDVEDLLAASQRNPQP